ncbi:MAG: SAM-dependent methyltransferase [Bdellovibrionaceae bacterium]|nr:SAM-dependent methyltransferase [Pseudobdellovibrionaceae bacterium]|tara:strand:+ start:1950 stop:2765 length:816 start_codon:yes stop_codon:yes gene_type:complete
MSSIDTYLHGYNKTEQQRLKDQAELTEFVIYQDVNFQESKHILEVGCGVGAQSEILLRRFPKLKLTGIDMSHDQLQAARENLKNSNFSEDRYEMIEMNAEKMKFDSYYFDGAFLCWILEHVKNPTRILSEVRRVLKPGSPIYITEVMNSSFFLDPYAPHVWKYWMAFNDFQYETGGDPFIGAKLGNFLFSLGFKNITTSVKTWHFDNREPKKRQQMMAFWTELLKSGAPALLEHKKVDQTLVEKMEEELEQISTDPNGVIHYSFMQASAIT